MRKKKETLYEKWQKSKAQTDEYLAASKELHVEPEKVVIKKVSGFGKFIEIAGDNIRLIFKIFFYVLVSVLVSFALTVLLNPATRDAVFRVLGPQ